MPALGVLIVLNAGRSRRGRANRSRIPSPVWMLAVLLLLTSLPPDAQAGVPALKMLEAALHCDPSSPSAPRVLRRMGRLGEPGWRLLAKYAEEMKDGRLRWEAVKTLSEGTEKVRLELAAGLYDRTADPRTKALLAVALARSYPRYAERLSAHLRKPGPGALDVLRILGHRGLPRAEIVAAQKHPLLADLAREFLQGRGPAPEVIEMIPRARELAPRGLTYKSAAAFAKAYAEDPYRPLLRALAEVLRETDPSRRRGAYYLLLTVSGVANPPDADLWNSWITAQGEMYTPPDPVSRGAIAAAVARGVRYLRADLAADGRCRHGINKTASRDVGCTALAVLALRSAGVAANDEVLKKAVEKTLVVRDTKGRPGIPKGEADQTYSQSLLAMAYQSLGWKEFKYPLELIRIRLSEGMLVSGEWTYGLPSRTKPTKRKTGDHSNTQYANLGLRAIRAAGHRVPAEIWQRMEAQWRGSQLPSGAWEYRSGGRSDRRLNFTPSGIAGLAIAAEALHGSDASAVIAADANIGRGLKVLGQYLLRRKSVDDLTLYVLYAIERACALSGVHAFVGGTKKFDWYREGAWSLLRRQGADGSWGLSRSRSLTRHGCSKGPDTAFGLLFLSRATATVGDAANTRDVDASLTPEEIAKLPKRPVPQAGGATPRPWETAPPREPGGVTLRLASRRLRSRPGKAIVAGFVEGPWSEIRIADRKVVPDKTGHFASTVRQKESGSVEVLVTDTDGRETRAQVAIEIDRTPPSLKLVGPRQRAAAVQRIELEADEAIDGVKVGRRFFPAQGRHVMITTELKSGRGKLPVEVYDLAGNYAKPTIRVEVANQALELNGKSAVRVALPKKPAEFTLECWVKLGAEAEGALLSDAHGNGAGLFVKGMIPYAVLNPGGKREEARATGLKKLPTKRWTHVAMTCGGDHLRLWVDGRLVINSRPAMNKYIRSRAPLWIGADPNKSGPGSHLTGQLDEVRLSSVVRYIESFKPARVHAPDRHTVVLFHFDVDTGRTFADSSWNGRVGQAVGKPRIVRRRR